MRFRYNEAEGPWLRVRGLASLGLGLRVYYRVLNNYLYYFGGGSLL